MKHLVLAHTDELCKRLGLELALDQKLARIEHVNKRGLVNGHVISPILLDRLGLEVVSGECSVI